jgi:hypothetical protein
MQMNSVGRPQKFLFCRRSTVTYFHSVKPFEPEIHDSLCNLIVILLREIMRAHDLDKFRINSTGRRVRLLSASIIFIKYIYLEELLKPVIRICFLNGL